MKAAVLHQYGTMPQYEDFPDPVPQPGQQLISVTAAAVKNLDRMIASGKHYHKMHQLPAVVGVDGVGTLPDGTRVYTGMIGSMMAERAVADPARCTIIPAGTDDITAAALPNPGLSAWFSLQYRGAIQPGDTVLILGATGVTGKIAIQLAKHLGAGHIIATGRNPEQLAKLPALGADTVIAMKGADDDFKAAIAAVNKEHPIDIVVDYLWGAYAEIVLHLLAGNDLNAEPRRIRFVHVGEMSGSTINLHGGILRGSAIELYGIGGGSIPGHLMKQVPTTILPHLYQLAADGRLIIETETLPLSEIASTWQQLDKAGRRLVLTMVGYRRNAK